MIVNSQPYNPSQQSQQQRCIGLTNSSNGASNSTTNQHQQTQLEHQLNMGRMSGSSQQNSLYGSAFGGHLQQQHQVPMQQQQQQQQSHMFDLANLQGGGIFETAYDIAIGNSNNNSVQQQQHQTGARTMLGKRAIQCDNLGATQTNADPSLYSPSSSTSLLYHIYDQINSPNDQQTYQQQTELPLHQQQQHAVSTLAPGKKNTTILNPANLFGQQQPSNQNINNSNNLPLQMPPHHLHQLSQVVAGELQPQKGIPQQQCYSSSSATGQYHLQQQQPFGGTMHHHNHHQHQSSYLSAQSSLMLDTMLRQHHAATTARQQHHHQRPLSSSGASSMSGQSMGAIAYGRQARTTPATGGPNGKSHAANLASVLQSSNTLNHLGIGGGGAGAGASGNPSCLSTPSSCAKSLFSSRWKRFNQRARHFAYEYQTIIKCSILLILLAFTLMSIIKFTLLSASSNHNQTPLSSPSSSISATLPFASSTHLATSSQLGSNNNNNLIYPPFTKLDAMGPQRPHSMEEEEPISLEQQKNAGQQQQQQQPDGLKSKLLIGEFVILSQNYSHSSVQRSLLAERIVKLMDQVFLATDVRRVYSRMEVTNVRANKPSGIVVDCNIILSDSIAYAAQQFGIALYDSLSKSHERLANQANYIIDKNSIRFNTVPDKDLKSGLVPPGLISPSVSRELALPVQPTNDQGAPSVGQSAESSMELSLNGQQQLGAVANADSLDQMNSVVWSEWSQWSSCVDKNGVCDPTRLHSRLRRCVAQHTGAQVEVAQCKQRFNPLDQDLEVADCSRSCSQQQMASSDSSHIMSDAPSVIGPQTAPSVLVEPSSASGFMSPPPPPPLPLPPMKPSKMLASAAAAAAEAQAAKEQPTAAMVSSGNNNNNHPTNNLLDLYTPASATAAAAAASSSSPGSAVPITESGRETRLMGAAGNPTNGDSSSGAPTVVPLLHLQQQQANSQMSCSNCTSDEICLLLMQQKVPFCAKIKERTDESGCGGWCKAQNQLCQPVGQNAFKCIHDSECLAEEWRCHDSACIPLSKRCDGHSNCYDNSDERDCPNS